MYAFKNFDISKWPCAAASKILHQEPKFSLAPDGTVRDSETIASKNVGSPQDDDSVVGVADEDEPSQKPRSRIERENQPGCKAAKKQLVQESLQKKALKCLSAINESMKRKIYKIDKTNAIRTEMNALTAYSMPMADMPNETEEYHAERIGFVRAVRRKYTEAARLAAIRAATDTATVAVAAASSTSIERDDDSSPNVKNSAIDSESAVLQSVIPQ